MSKAVTITHRTVYNIYDRTGRRYRKAGQIRAFPSRHVFNATYQYRNDPTDTWRCDASTWMEAKAAVLYHHRRRFFLHFERFMDRLNGVLK